MATSELHDYSANQTAAAAPLSTASNLILIDNYDSFTWNVYQYLILEGASVRVFRNDEITLEHLISLSPTQLVISPGPGHPDRDTGVSRDAISHFAGKIPILGVCMGEQCIFSVFGGVVDVTGEIMHGKTSALKHDDKGVYRGVPQGIPVTRYHSLAGTHATLPECLEVSSWTASESGKDIIMGVRHKEYVVEGVQFHPESILTASGRVMLKNFLAMSGGRWSDVKATTQTQAQTNGVKGGDKQANILTRIYDHRRAAVAEQKLIPSQRPSDLEAQYDLGLVPPLVNFESRLRNSPFSLSLLAEVKRASPSKGPIAMDICAATQARQYASAGASVISVLTEPEWFKGSIDDLRAVRRALEGMPHRPAILRKEFIFEEYQILEARLAGADTVLLIVKMLDLETLTRLYRYSQSLHMEPLVEVQNTNEMRTALNLGAKVIGVNNRDLTSFHVDLDTTSRLMATVPKDTIVLALSGIGGSKDVEAYRSNGVSGVLVGEALMRAKDVSVFVRELLGGATPEMQLHKPMVKICGTRTPEAAQAAIAAGAEFIGIILVEGRSRCVDDVTGRAISDVVHLARTPVSNTIPDRVGTDFFEAQTDILRSYGRPLLVGVFQNQSLSYILSKVHNLSLDVVQLHGSEPLEWSHLIPVPVLRRFAPEDPTLKTRGYHVLPLLDSAKGGTGQTTDASEVSRVLSSDPSLRVALAGGLNPGNVRNKLDALGEVQGQVVLVDVSSGVETDGQQDVEKIREFVKAVKG